VAALLTTRRPKLRRPITTLLVLAALLAAVQVEAQFRGRRGFFNTRMSQPADVDGRFQFCRVAYNSGGGDGGSWQVDWPAADVNLSIRFSELTKADVSKSKDGNPNTLLVRLTDDVLFSCPLVVMTEVGRAELTAAEAARLREYLLKGGFLWADDFWGDYAWDWWEAQLRQALPAAEFPIIDLTPTHPLYSAQFVIKETPQIASIGHWYNSGGGTSERYEESAQVNTRAILNEHGHVMVLMTHNTDLGDSFERESEDPQYFYTMSVPGYAFGVNLLLYAMTH
jgi:hypothetical protein